MSASGQKNSKPIGNHGDYAVGCDRKLFRFHDRSFIVSARRDLHGIKPAAAGLMRNLHCRGYRRGRCQFLVIVADELFGYTDIHAEALPT
jgi:hypothetical protein